MFLNEVLKGKPPGGQINASQSEPVVLTTWRHLKPQRETSVSICRGCLLEKFQFPALYQLASAVRKGLGKSLTYGSVIVKSCSASAQAAWHSGASSQTLSSFTRGAASFRSLPKLILRLLSSLPHFLSLLLTLVDNPLDNVIESTL